MTSEVATITLIIPHWRIRAAICACVVARTFTWGISNLAAEAMCDRLAAWVVAGAKIKK